MKHSSVRPHTHSPAVELHEKIAKNWSAGYSRRTFSKRFSAFERLLERAVTDGRQWLDLGCGTGTLTRVLLDHGAAVTAFDGSPAMLTEVNRLLVEQPSLAIRAVQGDAADLGLFDQCAFDGVLCSSVLEYMDDPDMVLREISRVLRPNGVLILSLPPKRSLVREAQKAVRRIALFLGKDPFAYLSVSKFEIDPREIGGRFAQANFSVDTVTAFDPLFPGPLLRVFRPALLIIEAHKA